MQKANRTVAIIDDNTENRLVLRAMLEDFYSVVEYESGEEALSAVKNRKPDVILLDISLPGMDGVEVLRRLHADEALSDVGIVAVTAHAMRGDRERFLSLGFDAYLSKPIRDIAQLVDLVGSVDRGCLGRS